MRMAASRAVMRARRICVCVVVAAALLLLTAASATAWWNSSWKYRRAITIQSDGELTDFQVLVVLNSTNFDFSKAKADGGDVRFVDEDDATKLSYWIEEWDAAAETARIWVKVPSIPAGNKTIYIYYNNSEAVSESDGEAVFEFFDDFEGTSLDTSKWSVSGDGTVEVANSIVTVTGSAGTTELVTGVDYFSRPAILEAKALTSDANWVTICFTSSDNQDRCQYLDTGSDIWRTWVGGTAYDLTRTVTLDVWRRLTIKYSASAVQYIVDGNLDAEETTHIPSTDMRLQFGADNSDVYVKLDWIAVRKYASPEPSVSVGAEEEYTSPSTPQDPNLQITCVPPFTLKISLTTTAESGFILIGLSPSKYAYAYPHHGSGNYTLTATFLQTNVTYYCVACGEGGENCTNVTAFTCECAEELVEGGYDTSFRELLAGGDLLNVTKLSDAVPDVYRSLLGDVFWALFFGGIFVAFWIRQEDVMLPSIVGLVCGGAMLMLLPPSAQRIAYILLVISIAGTLYSIIKAKR
ncbi:MAG TPA: DUF2341 domain-containing protein [Methanomicrobia archaeon]|nr:DUF2341 domain-containing protein [Methanomicrobia archaeon]HEX59179.1 DUF2341 domain-containing protein [Methanomicrobia archaeon]